MSTHSPQPEPRRDFYISYTKDDASWADWLQWHLEEEGFSAGGRTPFQPGNRFDIEITKAFEFAKNMIVVLSNKYVEALQLSRSHDAQSSMRVQSRPMSQTERAEFND